ncbi:hypothetical protein ACM66B_001639 [Microbotryomycetes sp. NB124-2]
MPAVAANRRRDFGAGVANDDRNGNQQAAGGGGGAVEFENEDERIKAVRHLFVQSMLNRSITSEKLATTIYDKCCAMCQLQRAEPFPSFLAELNDTLAPLMLEIKRARDQETGVPHVVFTNLQSDTVAKIATEFTAAEIAFFRSIVEAIVRARKLAYAILFQDAIKLYKGTNRQTAQNTLRSLVAKGWLRLLPSGHVILSTRSLSELSTYIKEQFDQDEDDEDDDEGDRVGRYKAIVQCHACFDPVTIGYICPNPQCNVRLHKFCVAQRVGQTGHCPDSIGNPEGCSQAWYKRAEGVFEGEPVGVEALGVELDDSQQDQIESEEEQPQPATTNGRAGRRRGARRAAVRDEDEDEDEMDED